MLKWLLNNKEWLFSGAAVALLVTLFNSLLRPKETAKQPTIINTINNNIDTKPSQSTSLPKVEARTRPHLFELPPRTERRLSDSLDGALGDHREPLETFVATYKLSANEPFPASVNVMASIQFFLRYPLQWGRGGYMEKTLQTIDHGRWLSTFSQSVTITSSEPQKLLLAVYDGKEFLTVDATQPPYSCAIDGHVQTVKDMPRIYVRVTLIDVDFGWRWKADYAIESHPANIKTIAGLSAT